MASTTNTSGRNKGHDTDHDHVRRANPMGAYLASLGAIVFLVSVWLPWLTKGPGESERRVSNGYEGDGVIPLLGYLGLGFAIALIYAVKRADRRQHRGLSLASFAVGLAAFLWAISFIIEPISTTQYGENVTIEWGAWVAAIGGLLWALGSLLLAKEPEGDREHDDHVTRTVGHTTGHTTGHTETHRVDPEVHRTTDARTTTEHATPTHGTTTGRVTGDDRDFGTGTTGTNRPRH